MSDEFLQDTLKRTHDDGNGPAVKRAHLQDDDEDVLLKILIPSSAVGAIIGKGGETMRTLKNDTKCRVQMSKNQDVYPGTNERICLVRGRISQVMIVIETLMGKIRGKVEGSARDPFDHKDVPRANEVKILMPNTSAAMVIGRGGMNIRDIREGTGCQIQVFPKSGTVEAQSSQERVVTMAHDDLHKLLEAVERVLERVAADPQHAQYADKDHDSFISGASASSGFFSAQSALNAPKFNGFSSAGAFQFNPLQNLGNNELLSFLDSLQATLRTSGFNEMAVTEVMQAMQVLAKYNIMGLGLGLGVAAMAQMRSGQENGGYPASNVFSGSTTALDQSFNTQGNQPTGSQCWGYSISQMGQPQNMPLLTRLNTVEAGGHAASVISSMESREENQLDVQVPDSYIGAILGSRARTLIDIQQQTGAKITVHKRGEEPFPLHDDDTRLISIVGDADQRLAGRLLIERVINDNFNRRQVS
ncbi:unnamed protein product, partial [Mesorhabditis spiculigera]